MELIKFKGNKTFSVKNISATKAEILIYGEVGESWWGDSITAKQFKAELDAIDKTVRELVVRVNSPGGDVFDGFAIYNMLKNRSEKIIVYIDGLAASIASIIALAGDEVIMGEGALYMIHKPWTMAMGNANDLENKIDLLDKIEQQLITVYSKKTGLDRIELEAMLGEETWFDSSEALEKGFIDRTMEDEEGLSIAASILDRAKWINKKPKIKDSSEVIREKIENFKQEAEGFLTRK